MGVDAAEELLAAMDRPDADLLVIGIRHRSPVGKLLLGSVSQQLILECPKPVLRSSPPRTDVAFLRESACHPATRRAAAYFCARSRQKCWRNQQKNPGRWPGNL